MDTASAISCHRNERLSLAAETEELLRLLDEDRVDELRERSAQELAMENAAHAVREFEERRRAALTPPDGLEGEAEKLAAEYRDVIASVRNAPLRKRRVDWALFDPGASAADGIFHWSRTTLVPMPGHFDVTDRPPPGGSYFFSGRRRSDDVGLSFEVLLRAHFFINPDELPPSTSGVWVSSPAVDLRGDVWADTERGSTLAECKLFRMQTVYENHAGKVVVLGSRQSENLVVQSFSLNSKRAVLQGLHSMPVIEFAPSGDRTVWATLEVRFAGSVRGRNSEVTIGTRPPEDGVILQIPQWRVLP